jgi:hypothetical protein
MKNITARFPKGKSLELSELGTKFNLSFSSQLVFRNKIIALDGIKKCLLVLDTGKEPGQPYVIDLKNVASVTVKKTYGSIKAGELKNKGMEDFLKRIELQFDFSNKGETTVLPFYESDIDNQRERAMLARNAKNWQMILSKLIGSTEKTIRVRNELALVRLSNSAGVTA